MTKTDDQIKIEDEANLHQAGICQLDGVLGSASPGLIAYHKFKAGVSFRTKNPSPAVMGMKRVLEEVEMLIDQKTTFPMKIAEAAHMALLAHEAEMEG